MYPAQDRSTPMTRTMLQSLRLVGATIAVAAGIAGFATIPAAPAPADLAVVQSFTPAGQ
jgi:hypothetical protein